MQWSKLKKQVESRFAPAVAGRVELRTTNYRKVNDWEGRGWITLDKNEIYNFCTQKYLFERWKLSKGIQEANRATDFLDPAQREGYYRGLDAAEEILDRQGVASQDSFEDALESYLNLTVEEALVSGDFIHRALAVLDRRLGKRRLRNLTLIAEEHQLVRDLLAFRLGVEGIKGPGDS